MRQFFKHVSYYRYCCCFTFVDVNNVKYDYALLLLLIKIWNKHFFIVSISLELTIDCILFWFYIRTVRVGCTKNAFYDDADDYMMVVVVVMMMMMMMITWWLWCWWWGGADDDGCDADDGGGGDDDDDNYHDDDDNS